MRRRQIALLAQATLINMLIAFGFVFPAAAQTSSPALELNRKEVVPGAVEMPPLLFDLFHSTGQPNSPPPTGQTPLAQGLANVTPVATNGEFVPDEVLVTLDGDRQATQALAQTLGLEVRSLRTSVLLGTTVARLGIPDGRAVGTVLAQINQDGRATVAEPNHVYSLQQASSEVSGYAMQSINFRPDQASGSNIRIAVIDSARDKSHPALANIDAVDFDALPEKPVSDTNHGTSIVGLIAGQNGFQGIAPAARIFHARAFENGKSNTDAILAAIDWAAGENVQIINMSFVGPRNRLFERACEAAKEHGILLVAAAGNNGPKAPPAYPGAYKSVVAVTATDEQNKRMDQANVGSYISISTPGVAVFAPIPGGGFDAVTGTSFAAAIYTGAIANLMQKDPARSAFDIEAITTKSATDLGKKGKDIEFGFGLINFAAAASQIKG